MILIADSGSTKTDWCGLDGGQVVCHVATQGINPVHQSDEDIRHILETELAVVGDVSGIFFYGAGCTPQSRQRMAELLRQRFQGVAVVDVQSDLLAAARALCSDDEGIACILGTGANSCYYDGNQIKTNVPPLGYILGDEGSGAVLGKLFLNALFKGDLPDSLRTEFLCQAGMTYEEIIHRVYRQPLANRFMASLSVFIHDHLEVPGVRELVVDNFRAFIRKNVSKYKRPDLPLNAVGSVAFYYQEELQKAAAQEGCRVGRVLRSPMEGLIAYHLSAS